MTILTGRVRGARVGVCPGPTGNLPFPHSRGLVSVVGDPFQDALTGLNRLAFRRHRASRSARQD